MGSGSGSPADLQTYLAEELRDHAKVFFNVRFEITFRCHFGKRSGPMGRWRDECGRELVRFATLKSFADGFWQPGGIHLGAFDQENQINQVLDAGIFTANAGQGVGVQFLGKLFFR